MMNKNWTWRFLLAAMACSYAAGFQPIFQATPYKFDLSGIADLADNDDLSGPKRVVSTATNSPIFYIDRLDFSSLFQNFLQPPRFPPSSAVGHKNKKRKKRPTTTTTTQKPTPLPLTITPPTSSTIQMLPLPFVSNAKPFGFYKLKWSSTTPTTTTTTTAATSTTVRRPVTTATLRPPRPTNSRIIRLKTKFLANGRPSSVFMFSSPHRRYSLKELLQGPAAHAHRMKNKHRG